MEDKRKFKRFPVQVSARCIWASQEKWIKCSVTNVSREGMGIEVYLKEKIQSDEMLQFKIMVPSKEEPIRITGTLVWIKELNENMGFVGGIKFINVASEEIWTLLDYANENWLKSGEEQK